MGFKISSGRGRAGACAIPGPARGLRCEKEHQLSYGL
jgi:hypothetical protein